MAKATDNGGATTTSATVNITVNAPPTVSVTSPANGASFTAPASITISANASDSDGTISSVQFFHGTTMIGTDTSAPYSFSWNNVVSGGYSLTAKATDNSGTISTSSAVNVTVNANGAPTVSITGPANGATFTAPANVTITANATDGDGTISNVEFYQGTTLLGTDTTAPYAFNWSNVAAGNYSLTAKATDNGGSITTSSPVSITVNPDQPPTVSITGPANGATFTAPASISITSNASDNDGTVSSVEFYQGTTLIGTDTSAPYTLNWNNVAAGSYSLTAKATDNAGGTTTSGPVSITVNAAPVPIPLDGHASLSYDTASNRITTAGFAYDAAGNQVQALIPGGSGSQRYRYDAANRLVQVRSDDSNTVIATYTYGDSNERLIAEEGSRRTYYACDSSAEYVEDGTSITPAWWKTYVYLAGRLLSLVTPNGSGGETNQFHHPDRLGTRLVTNPSDGTSVEQVTLPFGTELTAESTGQTNRRFTSYDRSSITGLDYAVNRHYDPRQGRFTQVDPAGMRATSLVNPQTLNMYAYCANDPINRTDADGLGLISWFKKVFKKIIRAFVHAVIVFVISFAMTGGNLGAALAMFASDFLTQLGWQSRGYWHSQRGTPPTFPAGGVTLSQIFQGTILERFFPGPERYLRWSIGINGFAARCPPSAKQLLNHPKVKKALQETLARATARKIEHGGWVMWHRVTGQVKALHKEPATSPPLPRSYEYQDTYYRVWLHNPPGLPRGWVIIAQYHAHLEPIGPTPDWDDAAADRNKIPGLLVDSKKTYTYGHYSRGIWNTDLPNCR